MSAVQHLLETTHTFLKSSPVYSSLPMSVVSLGLEKLAELNLSCPCNGWSDPLIILIFIAPALFLWALMFFFLAPFRYCSKDVCACCKCCSKCKCCTSENTPKKSRNDRQLCFKAFTHSLFPSIMWIVFLFLDGDYLACSYTTFEGDYVFDPELNRKWCEPHGLTNANENDLHKKYRSIVGISQVIGYAILGVFGLLNIIFFFVCYIEKPRTKETDVQTEQGENGMEPAGQVETPVQIEVHTIDPHRRRGDMQTGSNSSAHPQGKAEDDIEEESKRLVGEEGISKL